MDSLLPTSGAARRAALVVEEAQATRRLVRAERRPAIGAALGVQRFEGDAGRFSVGPVIGASITLPFTAARANAAASSAADLGAVVEQAESRAMVARARAAAAAARDRYETVRARLSLYDAALLRGARDERESALAAYRAGELSLLELLDFERALARAEIDRLRTRMDAA
ncbi:MAG: TolC family protein, partial [Gammaproteobacteria bacterium]